MNRTTNPFSVFDFPGQILHVPFSPGVTNQSTGVWTAGASGFATPIKGNIQEVNANDLQTMPEGVYEVGDIKIITSVSLPVGDILQITEPDGVTVVEWTVKTFVKCTNIIPKFGLPVRNTYLLKKRG